MLMLMKEVGTGFINGLKWYGRRIQESKWYIIPLIIDTALIPLKIVVVPLICLIKRGRNMFVIIGSDMEED
jgi:hypothetical protein